MMSLAGLLGTACAHRAPGPAPAAAPLAISPVPPVDSVEEGLVITQEPKWIRVKALSIEAVFPAMTIDSFRLAYRSHYAETSLSLKERLRRRPSTTALPPKVLHDVVQCIVIEWFYFYNINKREVRVSKRDLSHPQTYQTVRRVIAKTFPLDTPEHTGICASLLDMTERQFLDWERSNDQQEALF